MEIPLGRVLSRIRRKRFTTKNAHLGGEGRPRGEGPRISDICYLSETPRYLGICCGIRINTVRQAMETRVLEEIRSQYNWHPIRTRRKTAYLDEFSGRVFWVRYPPWSALQHKSETLSKKDIYIYCSVMRITRRQEKKKKFLSE